MHVCVFYIYTHMHAYICVCVYFIYRFFEELISKNKYFEQFSAFMNFEQFAEIMFFSLCIAINLNQTAVVVFD